MSLPPPPVRMVLTDWLAVWMSLKGVPMVRSKLRTVVPPVTVPATRLMVRPTPQLRTSKVSKPVPPSSVSLPVLFWMKSLPPPPLITFVLVSSPTSWSSKSLPIKFSKPVIVSPVASPPLMPWFRRPTMPELELA